MSHDLARATGRVTAVIFVCTALLAAQAMPGAAETYNACRIYHDGLKKKIPDGKALVARGTLKIEKKAGLAFLTLRNDDGSCEVELITDPGETAQAEKCGDGATVTIIGKFESVFGLPAVNPASFACD